MKRFTLCVFYWISFPAARELGKKSDPVSKMPRKWNMMLDAPPFDIAYSPKWARPSAGRFVQQGRMRVTKANSLTAEELAALMIAVRDRQDKAAFAQLFAHYAPRVKAFLMKSGSDASSAEECAQDVMATLWHKSAQFDPARAGLTTWVYTIARNRRIDQFRRARRPEPEMIDWGPDEVVDQADIFEAAQETDRLVHALAQLPEKQRALIQRAYYGDLSHSEIAAETGLPLGTIKSRIRLALDRLRRTMS
jgi:RNA polymerase sigma factor (sigma-70 family)